MNKTLSILVAVLITVFFNCSIAESKGKLDHLKKYIGTYQHIDGPLFQDPRIKKLLQSTFGNKLDHLIRNLEVKGPVDLISNELVISGGAPHSSGKEMAILVVDFFSDSLQGAIYSQGRIFIFSNKAKYRYLPISMKDWFLLVNSNFDHRSYQPPNATWEK